MSPVPELTIPELLDQPWTKRLSRVAAFACMLMVSVGGGFITHYFFTLGDRVTAIELDRAKRNAQADENTVNLKSQIDALRRDLDTVGNGVGSVRVDLAEVKGILKQMRQDQVSLTLPTFVEGQDQASILQAVKPR